MLVYDKTGSIQLNLPLSEKVTLDQIKPGHTVLSLENASCLLNPTNGKLYLTLPKRMKYSKVYLYNHNGGEEGGDIDEYQNEVQTYCDDVKGQQLQEITLLKNFSIYKLQVKEI